MRDRDWTLALRARTRDSESMKLRRLTAECRVDDCPTIYMSDRGTVVFQGNAVATADGLRLGVGEQAVELPLEVVRQVLPELSGGR